MDESEGRKTETDYWDRVHGGQAIRVRLPSVFRTDTLNFMRLMRRYIRAGDRVVEIGFAPGKNLAWIAAKLGGDVTGIDYSNTGVEKARDLFAALRMRGDFRCEDMFSNSLTSASFDLAYSHGVIEHFDDPRPAVAAHLRLVKPGGFALLAIPNYGGIYGRLQQYFDPANLAIHNVRIMSTETLRALVPPESPARVRVFPFGSVVPSLVNWGKRWGAAAPLIHAALNGVGLVQPFEIRPLCPWLVLEVQRLPET